MPQKLWCDEISPGVWSQIPEAELARESKYGFQNVHELFLKGYQIANDGDGICTVCQVDGLEQTMSYKQFAAQVTACGSALKHSEVSETVGIWSRNSPEWLCVDLACSQYHLISVPLYDTLGPEALKHITILTKLSICFVENPEKARQLISLVKQFDIKTVERIVVFRNHDSDCDYGKDNGDIHIMGFSEFLLLGEKNPVKSQAGTHDDTFTCMFTSGTTGLPKGVMISHRAVLVVKDEVEHSFGPDVDFSPADTHLSFLPLPHVFERNVIHSMLGSGAKIAFSAGDPRKLFDEVAMYNPAEMALVPRMLNRLYDNIMKMVSAMSSEQQKGFHGALQAKIKLLDEGVCRKDTPYDVAFGKIRAIFGSNLKCIMVGGAPIMGEILQFFRATLGIPVIEAYGMTEVTGAGTTTAFGCWTVGNVGVPTRTNTMKLVDVPEMNYYAKNRVGEVCFKGINVMKGYFNEPEKTAETVDKDGYCHTGDIGEMLPDNTLRIFDRKKNIFKLQQGEYVAPEKIQNIYSVTPLAAQVFVDGSSLECFTVAVIVVEESELLELAKEEQLEGDAVSLCGATPVRKAVLRKLNLLAKENGMQSFEMAKNCRLVLEPFTVESGLLTPTLKQQRPAMRKHFKQDIADMYSEGVIV